jgi:hypothetical protein
MGENKETHERPVCVRWRPAAVFYKTENKVQDVYDCADSWVPDLLQQVSEETYRNGAVSEEVRNHVAGQAFTFRQMGLSFRALAHKGGVTIQDIKAIEDEDIKRMKALENNGATSSNTERRT